MGEFSNVPGEEVASDNFGLDDYEPEFFYPPRDWISAQYSIDLTFTDMTYSQDIFYFCHIHSTMSGRIKLIDGNGDLVSPEDVPELSDRDIKNNDFDEECGSFGLEPFQLPNELCPSTFVCGQEDAENEAVSTFATCLDAMNCAMLHGMTTGITSQSALALFIHQMIPHHQNAVNMAKSMLKSGTIPCDYDVDDLESSECVMNQMMLEIINGQNFQIQTMWNVLAAENYPRTDNCEVSLDDNGDDGNKPPMMGKKGGKKSSGGGKGGGKRFRAS
uniref:DUF305 domain-containing protein n=1 Tax=Entomoneis paludosa TaxID=265537 RepID=A0A7S3DQL4_9STRA